jgi:hypothetical protein
VIAHLAILVVYVVRDDHDEELLRLHLDRLERHTTARYTIYAAGPRLSESATARLAATPDLELCPTEPFPERGSREHAHHLDGLLAHALAGPADHFVTLDLDSFPVADAWHDRLRTASTSGIAAILRRENLDTVLPHPSCTFLPRGFVEDHPFSFSPDSDGSSGFRSFLRTSGQRADTGIRLARILAEGSIPWHPLLRSNRREVHPLIAGIYDDTIFHLGAGARESLFRRDLKRSGIHRSTRPLERLPVPRALQPSKRRLLDTLRRPAERRIVAANDAAAERARAALTSDADSFIAWLRGGAAQR